MLRLDDHWRAVGRTPDRRPTYEWASDEVELPPGLTVSGKFDVSGSRHLIAPMDALKHDSVREVNCKASVRGAKTLIADIFTLDAIANDHASVLRIMQVDGIAKDHAERRLNPMIDSCPAIAALLPRNEDKKRTQDIIFSNGLNLTIRGPSLSNLQSAGYKVVICDEPWQYKVGTLGHARARLGDFIKLESSKFVCISQGGEEASDWELQFASGELFEWYVPCESCGSLFVPVWSGFHGDGSRYGMVFDAPKNQDGTYNEDRALETLRYICHKCGHAHIDSPAVRSAWNRGGATLAKDGTPVGPGYDFKSRASFRWNAIIDWPWHELVKIWLSARVSAHLGDYEPTIQFWQKYMAEAKSERTVHEAQQLFTRAKIELADPKEKAWPDEAMRFLTADRQSEDIYWVVVRAWAKGTGESRRLWFGKLFSEAEVEEKRLEFGVPKNCTVVDSGYRPKGDQGVYSACIRYGWIAAKGDDPAFFWHHIPPTRQGDQPKRVMKPWAPLRYGDPGEGTSAQGRRRCPLIIFSSPTCKDRVQALIDRGLWVEPEDNGGEMEQEYKRQMSAEFKRPKIDKFTGRRVMLWVCPSGNNHGFDCSAMQVLCAMQAGLIPAGVELAEKPTEETNNEAKE